MFYIIQIGNVYSAQYARTRESLYSIQFFYYYTQLSRDIERGVNYSHEKMKNKTIQELSLV